MPSVAVISDIHGNLPALRAVMEDLDRQGYDEVIVAGDLIGRGPQGSAVVETIAKTGWKVIRGNHEDYILSFIEKKVPAHWLETREWAASRWMANELHNEAERFVRELPMSCTSDAAPSLRVVHGSPRGYTDGIGSWTSSKRLHAHLDSIEESHLACAHTHRPLLRELPTGVICNVGSVGLPFNGDQRAQYAVFHFQASSASPVVEFRQVEYDLSEIRRVYENSGFLAHGDVTAALLWEELRSARPHLVPFLHWARYSNLPTDVTSLPQFMDVFDAEEGMPAFFERITGQPFDIRNFVS